MTLPLTLALAAAALVAMVAFGWMGSRPPNPHKGPRLVPHRFLMLMSGTALLLLAVHVVNLLGWTTGR